LTTKPFRLEGTQLTVNIEAPQGALAVEVLDARGKPIPGYTFDECTAANSTDDLRFRPCWRNHGNLADLKGKTIQLRFRLKHATLYAFQIVP